MPFKSDAQRRAMYAAAGDGKLGIPKSVAREYIRESHGQGDLPERVGRGKRVLEHVKRGR